MQDNPRPAYIYGLGAIVVGGLLLIVAIVWNLMLDPLSSDEGVDAGLFASVIISLILIVAALALLVYGTIVLVVNYLRAKADRAIDNDIQQFEQNTEREPELTDNSRSSPPGISASRHAK